MNSETKSLGSQRLTLRGGTIGSHWDPTWKGRGWGVGVGGGGGVKVCRTRNTTLRDLLVIIEGV